MSTNTLSRVKEALPTVFDDFFKPWNEWFDGGSLTQRLLTIPAVNVTEGKDNYKVTLAAPGLAKDDFQIDIEGNIMTISAKKEEEKEEKEKRYTRKEYNYSSFSRSFTLPDEIRKDKIDAKYENGVLILNLPKQQLGTQTGHKIQVN